jgi:hypothetical protein
MKLKMLLLHSLSDTWLEAAESGNVTNSIAVLDLPESMTKVQGRVYMGLTNARRMILKYMLGVFTLFATLGFIGLWVNEIQDSIQS